MTPSRPVPWVSPVLYLAVLVAGGYAQLLGLGHGRPAAFLAGLAALVALDALERRRWPAATPALPAAVLLAVRAALFVVVAATDGSGLGRALFVLLPFGAYFAFGRTASIALGAGCVALVAVGYQLSAPRWYADVAHVSDLLMFVVGLALTIAMAAVAAQERTGRLRLERYAAQVAELSATAERLRVARDIHDGLGHRLTAVAVLLEKATAFGDRDPDTARQAVRDAQHCAREALDDVRRSVRTLRAEPEPFRLSTALSDLVGAAGTGGPLVSLAMSGDESGYGEPALTALYRAAQEGITNARRHSGATHVQVSVDLDPSRASLVVSDNGCGFPPGRAGFGLLGMRERVQLVHGRVQVDSDAGTGTRIAVTIPRRARP
jgi:signal transduction histidine kinase